MGNFLDAVKEYTGSNVENIRDSYIERVTSNAKGNTTGNTPNGKASSDFLGAVRNFANGQPTVLEEYRGKYGNTHGFQNEKEYKYWFEGNNRWESKRRAGISGKDWALSATAAYDKATSELEKLTKQRNRLSTTSGYNARFGIATDNSEYKTLTDQINAAKQKQLDAYQDMIYANGYRYADYDSKADYKTKAAAGLAAFDEEKKSRGGLNSIIRNSTMYQDTSMAGSAIADLANQFRTDSGYKEPTVNWTSEERNLWGYLRQTDPEEADVYAQQINAQYNAKANKETAENVGKWAVDNPFKATAATVASAPLHGLEYMADVIENSARGTISSKEGLGASKFSATARGAISENLNEKYGTLDEGIAIIGGKGLGDAYQLGTSIIDSLVTVAAGGKIGSSAVFFGTAAKSALDDALDRGATPEQALLMGFTSGAAELVFEQVSIDNLLSLIKGGGSSKFIVNLLKQGGFEASEEMFTSIANNITDALIMGDQSMLEASIYIYMTEQGMDYEQARKQAYKDMVEEIAYDTLGGFVSGTASGGALSPISQIASARAENRLTQEMYGEKVPAMAERTLELNPDSKLAKKVQDKVSAGSNVSGRQIRKLVNEHDRTAIKAAAVARLKELGETRGVELLADVLTKQAAGDKLTAYDKAVIKSSVHGARVLNEMQPHNVQSGEYSSDWARNIGTERINVDEYNRIVEEAQIKPENNNTQNMRAEAQPVVEQTAETGVQEETVTQPATENSAETQEVVAENANTTEDAGIAYRQVYNMGKAGVSLERAKASVSALTAEEIEAAYNEGAAASEVSASERATANTKVANGKSGRREGVVKGENVDISDLTKTFNDTQHKAYKVLSIIAKVTGIDIVLYKSELNAEGKFTEAQGKFKWKENTIYIDINAGLLSGKDVGNLASYTMLRTFSHEFTHFIEKWNPAEYNNFRKLVFNQLEERGENVHDLIDTEIKKSGGKLSYDAASREVVAQAMTDILPDTNFVQELCEKHRTIFDKLLEKLKEFIQDIKSYYAEISKNSPKQARALQEEIEGSVRYFEDIVKMFDEIAVQAVESYQAANAVGERISNTETTTAETEMVEENTEPATETIPVNVEENSGSVPPKAETEEAKAELRKAVRMPIKGTNMEALLQGITSKELSMESITLPGSVDGFNAVQREYLVEALIKGVYTDKEKISVAVPYDGKFEIGNTPGNVAKVLNSLNVKVNQEVFFDKPLMSTLKEGDRLTVLTWDGKQYVSNGFLMLPTTVEGAKYVMEEHKANRQAVNSRLASLLEPATKEIKAVPFEGKFNGKKAVYEFEIDGVKRYFDKNSFKYLDGGKLYANENGSIIKSVDAEGKLLGYLMETQKKPNVELTDVKPAKLKSFAASKPAVKKPPKKETAPKETKTPRKPRAQSEETKMPSVTEESVKLEDFGEKIGGARKDLWSSRGLYESDLEGMNDREREKHVKKDNVWKRPDYMKLIEGGRSRGVLYAVNEIRKSLNQNISYRPGTSEESRKNQQALFIQTIRDIQQLAENIQSKADLEKLGYKWGIDNGYLEETGNRYRPYRATHKMHSNPALSGSNLFETVDFLVKNFDKLDRLAENKQFAVDAKSKVPAGYSIIQSTSGNDAGTWFVTKGHMILKSGFASYDDALQTLQNAAASKKKKTRFVPQQLLEVHRKGPNYRAGEDVSGQNYIDTFGFKGGEFGNWMSAKDRRVSLNYGFDALKDLAAALDVADGDISFGGKLSIAFGARGQGLSGASAHYEPDRQVINLTKMNGAGSLAHEWFHGLDDFMGGFKNKMASDNVRELPETTRAAMRNLITTMQYRDMTDEEADLAATKRFEQAQRSVSYQVKNQFNWAAKMEDGTLAEWNTQGFKRKPTQEDLEKYKSLLNSLLETGDGKYLDELSELRKDVVGRVIPKEDRESIAARLYALKPAEGEIVQRGRVRTDFYNNSRRFGELHAKDGDYWDSTVEMSARAFACYVADKTGKNNDYLSGHSDSTATLDSDANGNIKVVRAFPVGEERKAINAAFDQLIVALKSDGFLHDRAEYDVPEIVQYQGRAYLSNEAEMFRGDIDEWNRNNKPDGEAFILGSTGNVLQGLGAIESDVYMLSDKINDIFKDHPEMTVKEIKNIPEILENPVMVLASRNASGVTRNTRLTIFGMVKAQNGKPVMVAFDLHPVENKLYLADMQKVVSAYTKDNSPTAALNLIKNSVVLYADKDKTASLLHTVGFQNAYRIEQSGYIGNISYVDDEVKVTGKKFSEVFAENIEQYQQRDTLTDREVLAMAASEVNVDNLTDGEKDALRIFIKRLAKLEDLQQQRAEQGKLYREQQFGSNVDRKAAEATLNRMHVLDDMIAKASNEVLKVESAEVLKRVLKKARKVVEEHQRGLDREALRKWRERRNDAAEVKKYRERIRKDVNELSDWVLHPGNKNIVKHIPDVVKDSVIPFITSIDFTSKQKLKGGDATKADRKFIDQMNAVRDALKKNADASGLYSGYNDLPPDFMDRLQTFIDDTQKLVNNNSGEYVINEMSSAELKELAGIVKTLKKFIKDMNRFHANAMFQHVQEAGDDSIDYLGKLKNASGRTDKVSEFVFWQQIRPAYAFERFGEGGKAIYDGLRKGQATLAFNTIKIKEFADKTYTEKEVQAWEKEEKTFKLGGDEVRIPVSSIMSFYELSKRPQALEHILGEGVRVATYKKNGKKISDVGHLITPEDIKTIVGSLTERQKAVADALQQFMAKQGGEWGNYVSVMRFGEEMFGEEHYFPINSDGRHLQATAEEHPSAASLYALLNMSFTKELKEGANNRIVLYSIFDVFSNHMASMAQYNAFALPVLDALKWFNYKQDTDSVREQMARVYGVPEESRPGKGKQGYAENFVINIIKAFNGTEAQGVPIDETGLKGLRRYNMAQVAFNTRVIVQQPMSIARAALLVDYTSIAKGMRLNPDDIKKNIAEMRKYSGIAAWKSLGFYDINISRGLTDIIKHNTSAMDKIGDVGMKGAELMDTLTWAGIWSACKEEVIRKQHLNSKDAGFYEAVSKLFEDVIYKTQVVDSVLTKNEYLRSKGFWSRAIGSFMSEPTTTASMLVDAYDKYSTDMQRGMTRQQAWQKNKRMIGRVTYVYAVSAVLLAAVQAAADAIRDDDEYQEFGEKWVEAFVGNVIDELIPFNKLPILSDIYDLAKELLSIVGVDTYGNPPQSVFMQWYDSLVKGTEIVWDKIKGKETNYTWYGGVYKLLQAVSGMSGLPMAAATRETITTWNTIVGAMAPSLKVKTYEPSETNQIKYAYQDGWLTEEEAVNELITQSLVDNEDEAYWLMRGWESEDFSKYDAIKDAVRNGGDFKAAMAELTAHGVKEKEVYSQVKSQIGKWYKDGEITKQQATAMLDKHFDMGIDDIKRTVDDWEFYKKYGFNYSDRAEAYEDGKISRSSLIDAIRSYKGIEKEEAEFMVDYLDFKLKYPQYRKLSEEQYAAYFYSVERAGNISPKDAGIDLGVYAKYRLDIQGIKGVDADGDGKNDDNSVKNQIVPIIDALPLTTEQKDVLYLDRWAKSGLRNTPWH